jgi:signal transduction histidine kinase
LTLTLEEYPDLPLAKGDQKQLNQVLSILLTNALNYTPEGGEVTLRTALQELDDTSWVTIAVSDNGPGVSDADRINLFNRFYRGTAGRASGAPGTGLGLAIAKEIMDRHQGRIEVTSDGVPGNGTTFTMWLRAKEA